MSLTLAVLWVYLGSERPLSEAHTHYLSCISEQMPSSEKVMSKHRG